MIMSAAAELPVWKIHGEMLRMVAEGGRVVLVAPTGSGKTTQVPQMLLDAGVGGGRMVVVLQPRRIAARSVAVRVAWERGVRVGEEVGYQVRFDDRSGELTRICFVTEGVFLRWIQDDPELRRVGVVVFDEFHERNLLSDVALALVKRLQEERRRDLGLVVMSATLDAAPVAAYLGGCPVLVSEGQSYPVEVRYLKMPDARPMTLQAAEMVGRIVDSRAEGDILVFMPGRGEIQGTLEELRRMRLGEAVDGLPLHGELEPQEQDRVFAPSGRRKVIVSTNVAETSVTIEGIRHVVDSGTARVARYDGERGIGTLMLEPISRASADQRKGRAGRTASGTCHRLWTQVGHGMRDERNTPEIQRSDLAEVVLLLHSLGIRDASGFDWLDRPDVVAVERAERLLEMLGALADGELTEEGLQMLRLPMHPRYSRMLVEAGRRGCVSEAALCAALVSGRDLLMRVERDDDGAAAVREQMEDDGDSDFFTLMRAWELAKAGGFGWEQCRRLGINGQVARDVEQTWRQILDAARGQRLGAGGSGGGSEALRRCVMAGFIDQLARRCGAGKAECELTEGRAGQLVRESVVREAEYLVVAGMREAVGRGGARMTLLSLATAVEAGWVSEMFPQHLRTEVEHVYDAVNKRVAAVRLVRFRDLVIERKAVQRELDPEASGRCLAAAVRAKLVELPQMDHRVQQFVARVNLVHAVVPELEMGPFGEEAEEMSLARAFRGKWLAKDAQAVPLLAAFQAQLEPGQAAWLDELLPLTIPWVEGRTVKVSYVGGVPEVQVKLTECFGLKEHPVVCEGRLPVRLVLGTPDGKRLAVTEDWVGYLAREWPKQRAVVMKKFPGHGWR